MKFNTVILLILFTALPAAGAAQDTRTNGERQPETDAAQKSGQKQAKKDENNNKETSPDILESFKPSEEISEDLSVSFPVDI